jgi:Protein of unknown function (DUF4031)
MVADTKGQLLEMAALIGVNKKWIQAENTYQEHFDICMSKKAKAIKLGAVAVSGRELTKITMNRKGAPAKLKQWVNESSYVSLHPVNFSEHQKELLNGILSRQKVGYMLFENKGRVYLIVEHWKYLLPIANAKHAPLFKGKLDKNPLYIYGKL